MVAGMAMNFELIWLDYLPICGVDVMCTPPSVGILGKYLFYLLPRYIEQKRMAISWHTCSKEFLILVFAYTFFRNANEQVGQDSQPAGRCVDLASLLISQEIYLRTIHTNLFTINRLTYAPCAYSLHGAAKVLLITQALIANGTEDLLEWYKLPFNGKQIWPMKL